MDPGLRVRAIRRALGLAAIIARGHMEAAATEPKILRMHDPVLSWVIENGAREELGPHETRMREEPLGRLLAAEVKMVLFRAEQLLVLAWAIGVVPFMRHDQRPFDQFLAARVSFLRKDAVARLLAKTA